MAVKLERATEPRPRIENVPRHVAIIMDGNGRWANSRGLPRIAGHKAGSENVRPILEECAEYGVEIVTIYAFSTENWARPRQEVMGLMRLLEHVIRRDTKKLIAEGVKLQHIGRIEDLPKRLADLIRWCVDATKANDRIVLNLAFNYGGRQEIIDAIRRIAADKIDPSMIDEDLFSRYLYTAGQPDPDLIIRTAGEMRLSNYLIWQSAYAEYYATPVYWPDFTREELEKALLAYSQRERRFGKVNIKR